MNTSVKESIKNLLKITSELGLTTVKADLVYKKISDYLKQIQTEIQTDSLDKKIIQKIAHAFIESLEWKETIKKSQEAALKKQFGKQIEVLINAIFVEIKTPKAKYTHLSVHTSITPGNPIAAVLFNRMKTRRASLQGSPEKRELSAFDEEDTAPPTETAQPAYTLSRMQKRSTNPQAASSSPPVVASLSNASGQASKTIILVTSAETITDDLERFDTKKSSSPIGKSIESTSHNSQIMSLRETRSNLKDDLLKTSEPVLKLANGNQVPLSEIIAYLKTTPNPKRDMQQTSEPVLKLANGDQVLFSEIMDYFRTTSHLKRDMQQTSNPTVDELMGILEDIKNNPGPTTMDDEGSDAESHPEKRRHSKRRRAGLHTPNISPPMPLPNTLVSSADRSSSPAFAPEGMSPVSPLPAVRSPLPTDPPIVFSPMLSSPQTPISMFEQTFTALELERAESPESRQPNKRRRTLTSEAMVVEVEPTHVATPTTPNTMPAPRTPAPSPRTPARRLSSIPKRATNTLTPALTLTPASPPSESPVPPPVLQTPNATATSTPERPRTRLSLKTPNTVVAPMQPVTPVAPNPVRALRFSPSPRRSPVNAQVNVPNPLVVTPSASPKRGEKRKSMEPTPPVQQPVPVPPPATADAAQRKRACRY